MTNSTTTIRMNPTTNSTIRVIMETIMADPNTRAQAIENPTDFFQQVGLGFPIEIDTEFNAFIRGEFIEKVDSMKEELARYHNLGSANELTSDHVHNFDLTTLTFWKCTACKVGAYVVAGLLVAAGAGVAYLTVGSATIIALAGLLGISAKAALNWIKRHAHRISSSVSRVATWLCEEMGAC